MNRIVVRGGEIISPEETRFTDLYISDGLIERLSSGGEAADNHSGETAERARLVELDASGCYVTPGLIDLQLNGGDACDFWAEPQLTEVQRLALMQAEHGVTTFLPTLITADIGHLNKNLDFLEGAGLGRRSLSTAGSPDGSELPAQPSSGASTEGSAGLGLFAGAKARMPGVHLEGPCLSPQKPGVHPPEWLKPLTGEILAQLIRPSVLLMTVAPELDRSGEAIAYLQEHGVKVSLGHSNASFDEANQAFARGIDMVTHTYNALPPLHHRTPGAVMAAMLDDRVTCAVICDGLHVDPAAVRLLVKVKGVAKTLLVTDAARVGTTGGSLVGSSIYLCEAVRNVVNWGVASFADAIRMATLNAAEALGLDRQIGHLSPGKCADLVLWNKETLEIKCVLVAGEIVYRA